jgi:tol-pal system protein YbgF
MKHILPLSALVLVVSSAPAAAQSRETRQLMADIRILQSQTQELQNAIAQMNQTMAEALKGVNARLTEQADNTRKSLADAKIGIDTIGNDLRVVRERIDDNSVRVGTLAQEVDALREIVTAAAQTPAAALDPAAAAAAGTDPAAPGAPPASPPPAVPAGTAAIGAAPQKIWDAAMSDYWSGQYDLAIMGFETYAKSYPDSPRAGEALVNIGNSYVQGGNYSKAVEAYDRAIRAYPKSDALSDAYFKKGESLLALKDSAGAREAWEFVIKTYPDSLAALQAKQRLQGLKP